MNDIQSRIEVLRPRAGDTIAVHIDARFLTDAQVDAIRAAFRPMLPAGVKAMVLTEGVRLSHIVSEEPVDPDSVEALGFDVWMARRVECAHREFMERTSRRLPCDVTTEEVARYMGAPI